ncbi:MAG: hypothetical protein HYV63_16410 [Candidatus Schekmanbacteria bacterium]|nr:hypothetical protein [Candidatus Schekmanbacteria bacterium]
MPRPTAILAVLLLTLAPLAACRQPAGTSPSGKKIIRYPLRAKIGNLDPVRGATQYQNLPGTPIFERLISYRYPRVPFELRPELLEAMPEVSEDGLTYSFALRQGVRFQDDPAFVSTSGKGPEITADDVFYSIKRSCDSHWSPTGYWLFAGRIEGLDEYKAEQRERIANAAAQGRRVSFDYDAPVSGFRKIDSHHFQIRLTQPYPQFLYILAMNYAAIVPRQAVEAYDLEFGQRPVGSGPYRVREFRREGWLTLERNPTYREDYFPSDLSADEVAMGFGAYAGKRVPFLDEIRFEIFEQDQPMWLKFRAGDLDVIQVPAEFWPTAFNPDWSAKPKFMGTHLRHYHLPLLDLIYWGFNMQDPVWGVPPKMKLVRQAISYVVDLEARNQAFYNGLNTLYLGPIPPGLEGYEPGFRKPDVEKARRLLAEAGYAGGKGLPPLQYETSRGGNNREQAEMFTRQMGELGIEVAVNLNSFPELDDKLKKKKAPFFGLAWGADYPDAENFLQLFYGPNESPGSNNFNYRNPEYDALYEQAKVMFPSPERTALYRRLRDIVVEDQPMIGSMARTRTYLWHDRLKNHKPEEVYYDWWQYLDVVHEK